MEDAGLPIDKTLARLSAGRTDLKDGYQAALDLLSQPDRPTALRPINDLLAMAALRAAADLGLQVPRDVSIAGFDDISFNEFIVPRLTSVSGEPEQNGRDAVRLLLKRLADPGFVRARS